MEKGLAGKAKVCKAEILFRRERALITSECIEEVWSVKKKPRTFLSILYIFKVTELRFITVIDRMHYGLNKL